jgi:hypothetical protein
MHIIFASVLEEFARLPEFVLVSTIVLIGSVRPNRCLGVTLFTYFRFLFITRENYGVERQVNLLTEISLLHVSTSVHQYVSMPVCQYVSTSVHHCAVWLQYLSTSVHQYASTSVCQYVSTPCYLSYINPNREHPYIVLLAKLAQAFGVLGHF